MPIARREYRSVANMLVSTRGDAAEERAQLRITDARENQQPSEVIVWTELLAKIEEIRSTI